MNSLNMHRYLYCTVLSSMFLLGATHLLAFDKPLGPPENRPVKIDVSLFVNKVFNINTVDESYQVDGYLELSWNDERMQFQSDGEANLIFENEKALDLMNGELWFPALEMVNIQGERDIKNQSIEISPQGRVLYSERFYGTFSCDMDYREFPFDNQSFKIFLEAFSYDETMLTFNDPRIFPAKEESGRLFDSWIPLDMSTNIGHIQYEESTNQEDIYNRNTYSRVIFQVNAKRLSGYFVWQVLFPLFLIIVASFIMFWIKDFGTQLSTGFTLMLTVVAFNFFSSSILPELPYNTFIGSAIIVGYTLIFFCIVAVLVNNRLNAKRKKRGRKMLLFFRIGFPLAYLITMLILVIKFYYH